MKLNLNQVALFHAVVRERSVTRGAERMAVSQPAVSRAVAELEASLGTRLLDRGPKGVTPTEAGRVLAEYAERIFTLEREAAEALSDLRGLRTGKLSIGASTTVGDHLLPGAIAAFLREHPEIAVSMEVANTEAVQAGVEAGRYDVGFTEGEADPARFDVRVFHEDELVAVCAPRHAAAQAPISISELGRHGFVMREAGSGTRRVVERALADVGIEPAVAASLGSSAAIQGAVAAGLGIGVISLLAVQDALDAGRLVRVPVDFVVRRPLHRIRLPWRRESAALRAFLRHLPRRE